MYHCHLLPHEDSGMMWTFVVWNVEPLGIDNPDPSSIAMKVYPNPSQQIVYLQGASTKVSTLRFIDLNGRLIKKMTLPSFYGAIQIETDQLPTGMCIMDWRTYEGNAVSKVMVTK